VSKEHDRPSKTTQKSNPYQSGRLNHKSAQ
jgi:hypothetical protein